MAETIMELRKIWMASSRREEVLHGIEKMLESGVNTIDPHLVGEEELSTGWFSIARQTIEWMVKLTAKKLYGAEAPEPPMVAGKIMKILKWEEIVDGLGKDIVEKLGFLWYADEQLEEVSAEELLAIVDGISEEEKEKFERVLEDAERGYIIFPF